MFQYSYFCMKLTKFSLVQYALSLRRMDIRQTQRFGILHSLLSDIRGNHVESISGYIAEAHRR